jgi:DNA processing protein
MVNADEMGKLIEMHAREGDRSMLAHLTTAPDAEQITRGYADSRMHCRIAAHLYEVGAQIITIRDKLYPAVFQMLPESPAPPVLYCRGNLDLLNRGCIGVIGTRRPSREGRSAAAAYAGELAKGGISMVSGNAPGIDATAHDGVLNGHGSTLVFPPSPIEQFTPTFRAHCDWQRVLVASRFVPGAQVNKSFFLARNELVAALCGAAIIAETGFRGGTLNTLKHLRRLKRPVFITGLDASHEHYSAHESIIASGAIRIPLVPSSSSIEQIIQAARNPACPNLIENRDLFA